MSGPACLVPGSTNRRHPFGMPPALSLSCRITMQPVLQVHLSAVHKTAQRNPAVHFHPVCVHCIVSDLPQSHPVPAVPLRRVRTQVLRAVPPVSAPFRRVRGSSLQIPHGFWIIPARIFSAVVNCKSESICQKGKSLFRILLKRSHRRTRGYNDHKLFFICSYHTHVG